MIQRLALVLAAVLAASTTRAGDFGVQLQVDVPLDPASVTAFAASPLGYLTGESDLISLSAYFETGVWGVRFDLLSSQEARFGLYRIMSEMYLGPVGYQADLGAYVGYNWRGDGVFLRLRGRYVLYGTTTPDAPTEP